MREVGLEEDVVHWNVAEQTSGRKVTWRYDEKNREGDHICYISDMAKFRAHYPGWSLTRPSATEFPFSRTPGEPMR